ncbi:hypothetical protein ES319_D04G003000v1 [Gossypium barbadense]|uniref:Uncharacterized protein n=2 Tax=Gossypium TaxID=3633 RepID=A0A5J5RQ96_GOSBA|nr:hypothetical protein ES319_D04G003000v1 [Gossypium barbadense]TYG72229.1 hypothetical protein ES288_D04G003500v1 [Gossypium darwinii]
MKHPQLMTNTKLAIICSMISITRAFGNRVVKKYVIAKPEIQFSQDIVIDEELELLVLEAVALAWAEEAETKAKRLTYIAFIGMEQKITFGWNFQCIVIKFHHPESA